LEFKFFLGAGESGKSTVAKQMKILHTGGFTPEELTSYRPVVFNNTISSMKSLVSACEKLGISTEEKNKVKIHRTTIIFSNFFRICLLNKKFAKKNLRTDMKIFVF
jgi:hypothetical protein